MELQKKTMECFSPAILASSLLCSPGSVSDLFKKVSIIPLCVARQQREKPPDFLAAQELKLCCL